MGKMLYTQKFGKKTFRGDDMKDAYTKATRWYASNIIASDKFHHIQVEFEKSGDNAITMTLYASMVHKDVMDQHCTICREMHHSFFINEDTHCDRCSACGLNKRLESKLAIKLEYYKELLRKIIF